MRLAVVYLARAANDPRWLRFFLASLVRFEAGTSYDLAIIAKGFDEKPIRGLENANAPGLSQIIRHDASDETFATNTFFDVARVLDHDAILFFVSWARILAPNWGRIMMDGLTRDRTGVVGGSAGWEALDPALTPFPNPSIRTTGFCIRRNTWLALDPGPLKEKRDGNLFEAGPNSMTRQIEAMGLQPLVAGRDGTYFECKDWPSSRTFRSGDQENLLFADNRTQDYATGSLRRRRKLARLNWGEKAEVSSIGLAQRLRRRFWWKYDR